jgi:hypothetical protein
VNWLREGDQWSSDTMLGEAGGNGFIEPELEAIRQTGVDTRRERHLRKAAIGRVK